MTGVGEGEDLPRLPGPLRRYGPLLAVVAVALLGGAPVSRLLEDYRAVVLDVDGERALLFWQDRPPRWVSSVDPASAGSVVAKERGTWRASPVPSTSEDAPLLAAHRRYHAAYEGTVTQIRPPRHDRGASTAVIALDGGDVIELEVWAASLSTLKVGSRLRKVARTWDPSLINVYDDVHDAPDAP